MVAALGALVTPAHHAVISAVLLTEAKNYSQTPAKAYIIQPTAEEAGVEEARFQDYMLSFISDSDHYTTVLDLASKAKHTLWIGTADIKDLYILKGKNEKPFLGVISDLIGKGGITDLIRFARFLSRIMTNFPEYVAATETMAFFIIFIRH